MNRILIFPALFLMLSFARGNEKYVNIADFGAIPGDGICDAQAIQSAFDYAKKNGICKVMFAAGDYFLKERIHGQSNFEDSSFLAYILVSDFPGLQIIGAADKDGRPLTRLVRYNPCTNQSNLGGHMQIDNCKGLSIKNIEFDNSPQYATAGRVSRISEDSVFVEIFEGLPIVDGMAAYCMNAWDLESRELKHQPSLTFGTKKEIDSKNAYWHISNLPLREMFIKSTEIAQECEVGDGLSWHFGALTFFQLSINSCDNLLLENIFMPNVAGFGIQVSGCKNVTARDIEFRSRNNQLAVGPRDAFKIHMCDGIVDIDNMYVEGVRWDGQNVHGAFWVFQEKLSDYTFRATKKYYTVRSVEDDSVSFWTGKEEVRNFVKQFRVEEKKNNSVTAVFEVSEPLSELISGKTLVAFDRWDCDNYILRNSTFRNIAGCASIIKNRKVTLLNNDYENIMYPALVLGCEIEQHFEGTFPKSVEVRGCRFARSGWVSRLNAKGLVGIGNSGYDEKVIGEILFDNCLFEDGETGIDVRFADKVTVNNCTFNCVNTPVYVRDDSEVIIRP